MAKNYKKAKSEDHFLRNVIIGFSVIFVALMSVIVVTGSKELSYESFDHINSYEEIYTQSESKYIVYYYSESCSHCNTIKNQVLNFADDNQLNLKVYFFDAASATGDSSLVSGLTGTPTMMLMENGVMTEFLVGSLQIPEFITSVQEGTYTLD